eukprot:CAMPEP_0170494016 /NCGR_PEP_ID=MMETSP0208-20121228/14396_1 /TAXON_ID=197538 /ORGANISM="Strombidium inclinatum, Strain S3" /LENGTH=43 /DNA_ID= /DNA_START= /DNA_END= /DNA_ORIENTATION=
MYDLTSEMKDDLSSEKQALEKMLAKKDEKVAQLELELLESREK